MYHLAPSKTDNMDFFHNRVRYFPKVAATPLAYLFKVFPLDMSQSAYLMQSTRVPMAGGTDEIVKAPGTSRHVLLTVRGHFYTVDVLDPQTGSLLPPSHYLASVNAVLEDARYACKTCFILVP